MIFMKKTVTKSYIALFLVLFVFFAFTPISFAISPYDVKEARPPVITDEGILFTFKSEEKLPKYVKVIGDFNNWEESYYLIKNRYDVFVFLFDRTKERGIVLEEGIYRYRLLVDGIWMNDPVNNKTVYDRYGTELSYFEVKVPLIIVKNNPVPVKNNSYIFYYKNDKAKDVHLVGDFNNWNPYSLSMKRNKSGMWEIEVDILPGSYAYILIVDGVYRKDPLGTTLVFDRFDNEYSFIKLR